MSGKRGSFDKVLHLGAGKYFSLNFLPQNPPVTDPVAPFFSQGKFNIFHGGRQKPEGIENFSWANRIFYKGDF